MSKPQRLAPEAKSEIREAARWYEAQRDGLGEAFVLAIQEALERLAAGELHRRPVIGATHELGVERVLVQRFRKRCVNPTWRHQAYAARLWACVSPTSEAS